VLATSSAPVLPPLMQPPVYCPYRSAVTQLNLFGYGIAFLAVCWYNFQKLQQVGVLFTAPCACGGGKILDSHLLRASFISHLGTPPLACLAVRRTQVYSQTVASPTCRLPAVRLPQLKLARTVLLFLLYPHEPMSTARLRAGRIMGSRSA